MKNYLQEYRKQMGLLFICICIFAVIFILNGISLVLVGYGILLTFFFIVVILGIDFIYYRKKCEKLSQVKRDFPYTIEHLPQPTSEVEERYQELLSLYHEEMTKKNREYEKKQTQTLEYYNLWVHQIKTPIAAASLLLQTQREMLEDSTLTKEIQMEMIRIEQYVEMALGYQRLNFDNSDFVIKKQSLDELIRQSIRKFSKLFIQKKLALNYTPTGVTILTDEKWFCFLLEQILSNALKYTMTGGIDIYLQNQWLCIKDSGIGIAKEDLPRIFEQGFTGYNGRTDKKSTGIGLYLCKQVGDRLGHKLVIESEKGKGTTVFIDISYKEIGVSYE